MKLSISYFILATLAKCQVAEANTCEDNVVVLGDSYSDTGNLFSLSLGEFPPRDAYRDVENNPGRFTNGRVWIEYLADLMKLNQPNAFYDNGEGTNYAIGGAASGSATSTEWSPNLPGAPLKVPAKGLILQTEDVVSKTSRKCRRETLFAIWIGAVDLLMLGETDVQNIVTNIETSVNSLIKEGAIEFIILNLPQLADSPGYGTDFPTKFLSQEKPTGLRGSVTDFNTGLATMLQTIDACNPGVIITHVDIAPLFAEAAANPTKFGLDEDVNTPTLNEEAYYAAEAAANSTKFGLDIDVNTQTLNEIADYADDNEEEDVYLKKANALWFDGVHPTTTFHEAIANEVHNVVNNKNTKTGKNNKAAKITKNVKCPKGAKSSRSVKDSKDTKK